MSAEQTRAVHPWVAEGARRVRFGVLRLGPYADWEETFAWAQLAEQLGFDGYWVMDHPLFAPECWTTLAALAQRTATIRLGSLVSCVFFRPPALLARIAADVDRLSGGRLVLGLGIGDIPREFASYGVPLPSIPERLQAQAEAVQILRGVWGAAPFTLHGRHFQVEAAQVPPPLQQPYVPLLIGGGGERVTLRQVAQYADATNFGPHPFTSSVVSVADVQRKLAVLEGHCGALGRPYEAILRSHIVLPLLLGKDKHAVQTKVAQTPNKAHPVAGTPASIITYYRELAEAGMQYFVACIEPTDQETLHLLGEEVLPHFA